MSKLENQIISKFIEYIEIHNFEKAEIDSIESLLKYISKKKILFTDKIFFERFSVFFQESSINFSFSLQKKSKNIISFFNNIFTKKVNGNLLFKINLTNKPKNIIIEFIPKKKLLKFNNEIQNAYLNFSILIFIQVLNSISDENFIKKVNIKSSEFEPITFDKYDVKLNSEKCSIEIKNQFLELPIDKLKVTNHELLNEAKKSINSTYQEATYSHLIFNLIKQNFISGIPKFEVFEFILKIGLRTIQRRLKTEDNSFKNILESFKIEVAKNLLSKSLDVNHVSDILGYADSSIFIRAFKQYTGQTALKWKKSQ